MGMVSIIPWPPDTEGNSPQYTLNSIFGFQSRNGRSGEEKNRLFLPGIKPRSPSRKKKHFYCALFSAPEEKESSI
jgi:hypothetical protein